MKRAVAGSILILMFVVFASILTTAAFAQEKAITLRFTNIFPVGSKDSNISDQWCKEVEKRTNGAVKVRYYPASTLVSPPQVYESVVRGVVDVGNHVLNYTMGKFPLSEVLDYPLGYPSGIVATKLMNEYYRKFKPKEFDEVKVMYFHGQSPGILQTKKPVNKMEDLKGMKIRTSGTTVGFISALGGSPVALPMPDAYDAISKGVADGITAPYNALEKWKLAEVIKYTTENHGTAYSSTFLIAMNKDKWASIPPQHQKTIEQINQEWIERHGKVWDETDKEGKEYTLKKGNKIIRLSAEEEARWVVKIQPMFEEYVKKMKERGLPGDEILKFARDYLKAQPK